MIKIDLLKISGGAFVHKKMMQFTIENISADIAEQLCREITADLPEYFGLPDCNEHYAIGVKTRANFAVKMDMTYVGLLSLDFPYPENSNIYWMGVLRQYHHQGVGRLLLDAASRYASQHGAVSMTVETLAPAESDENYIKTYRFYESQGFKPLFNLKPAGYEWNMAYMAKDLQHVTMLRAPNDAIEIRAIRENDIPMIVSNFEKNHWPKPASTFETYCEEQRNNQRLIWLAFHQKQFAGYVTLKWSSSYSSFKEKGIPEIMDLNVLPPYRNKGIGSKLLDFAEDQARQKCSAVGIGVGLYKDYGSAQKIYISRGYQPDGLGVTYDYKPVEPGKMVRLDDDLVLWFTKQLDSNAISGEP